ncbi:MAG: hypothetical protein E7213_09310 [Clostridium sp.]|nr:hypothetical protein [Clostridium sp.]
MEKIDRIKIKNEDVKNFKLIGRGTTANVYLLDDNKVLKLYKKKVYDKRKERESKIIPSLIVDEETKLNIYNIYNIVEASDTFWIVLDLVKGKSLDSIYTFRLIKKCKILARLQYEVHNHVHIKEEILFKDYLKEKIEKADLPDNLRTYIYKTLEAMPNLNYTCHGDFHGGNIIIDKNNINIIDWAEAGRGDYHADIARTLTLLDVHPYEDFYDKDKEIKGLKNKLTYKFNKALLTIYLKEYSKFQKIDMDRLRKWQIIMDAAIMMDRDEETNKLYLKDIERSYKYFVNKGK